MFEEEVSGRGDSAQEILEIGKYKISLKSRKLEKIQWNGLPLAHQRCHALSTLYLSEAPQVFHSVATYHKGHGTSFSVCAPHLNKGDFAH